MSHAPKIANTQTHPVDLLDTSPEIATAPMEAFVVKHYVADERPTIKGNGFDGLSIGEERYEAEAFVKWLNARLGVAGRDLASNEQAMIDAAGGAFNNTFHKVRAEVSMDWWQRIWRMAVEWTSSRQEGLLYVSSSPFETALKAIAAITNDSLAKNTATRALTLANRLSRNAKEGGAA